MSRIQIDFAIECIIITIIIFIIFINFIIIIITIINTIIMMRLISRLNYIKLY